MQLMKFSWSSLVCLLVQFNINLSRTIGSMTPYIGLYIGPRPYMFFSFNCVGLNFFKTVTMKAFGKRETLNWKMFMRGSMHALPKP